jgi:hypothetical protein
MSVYERLGDDRFCTLQKVKVAATTLYALAAKRTPDYARYEIVEAIESGEIKTDTTLDAEILARIERARAYGVTGPDRSEKAQAKKMAQRDAATYAVRILKARLTAEDLKSFRRYYDQAGHEWFRKALNAVSPSYVRSLITRELISSKTGLPLSDKELSDYQLDRDTTPTTQPPPDAALDAGHLTNQP